jgi:hypothetical protein
MRLLVALALVAAAVAAGTATATTGRPGDVYVTRDSLDLPTGCSPREVAATVVRFLGAIDSGSESEIARYLAPPGTEPPGFQWVSVTGPNGHFAAYSSGAAARYLANQGEFYFLRELDVGRSWVKNSVALGFTIWRRPSGASEALQSHGKAEIHCPSKTIYVWSMADGMASFCAAPSWWSPILAPLVCVRGGRTTNADEVAPSYRPPTTSVPLTSRCTPAAVETRVLTLLRAYNIGDGRAFARGFHTSRVGRLERLRLRDLRLKSLPALASYVSERYGAGVGWTLLDLDPPARAGGPYRLLVQVRVRRQGRPYDAVGKVFVDCRTGLIRRLALPSIAP